MKLNKLASNQHQEISEYDKDFALNEAQLVLIKKKVGLNNLYKAGLDSFLKRYQDLEFLITRHEEILPKKTKDKISIYSFSLTDLKQKFFLPIDTYLSCSRNGCKDRTVIVENIVKHSDVSLFLQSNDLNPSFNYQATFVVISSGQYLIYTQDPQGEFKVDKVYTSYLRYPAKVCLGGYEDFDGTVLTTQDCEFPDHLEDELVELTVQNLALITENQAAAQASQIRANESE